jgi:small subunit ribosomal protein S9
MATKKKTIKKAAVKEKKLATEKKSVAKTESKEEKVQVKPEGKYIETVGRRKTSVARIRLFENSRGLSITVNDKPYDSYFPTFELKYIVEEPFEKLGDTSHFKVTAKVNGGGIHSQAEAVRHGISRALVEHDADLRKNLKPLGFLKRDPRMKERRKFGLKKARKAPQWAKR